jgi:hypothetical protein
MNRTERKEIETQVREIICQMKEHNKKSRKLENRREFEYNWVRVTVNLDGSIESWKREYFKLRPRTGQVWVVFFYYV